MIDSAILVPGDQRNKHTLSILVLGMLPVRKWGLFGAGQSAVVSAIERGVLDITNRRVIFFPPDCSILLCSFFCCY